jgi:hypothetical protein
LDSAKRAFSVNLSALAVSTPARVTQQEFPHAAKLELQKAYSNGSNDYFVGTYALRVAVPGPAPITIQAQGGGGPSPVLGITCTATGYLVSN